MEKHVFGGIEFDETLYRELVKNYSETFTHTSLSIEKEDLKLEEANDIINSLKKDTSETFEKLPDNEKEKIKNKYKYFVTYMAYFKGMIPKINFENQEEINDTYNEKFKEFDKYMLELIVFDEEDNFLEKETGKKVSMFFPTYIERKPLLDSVRKSRTDHISAFLYALDENHIGIKEMLQINEIINRNNPNHQKGFKKVNNAITGSSFETMKKEEVPIQISELIYKYDNNFDMDLKDPNESGISHEERHKRLFLICLKEARFHILFEHIHPFADGNGRTGRIITSTNLMRQHLAPPLITSTMIEQYKNFINNYDYQGLAQMLLDSSSQMLSVWVTLKRVEEGLPLEEIISSKTI